MNAVIVMNGATIIFTDEQGNVLDRFAVESITFADQREDERCDELPLISTLKEV